MEVEIEIYETDSGQCPFDNWFEGIRERNTRAKILTRLDRLRVGNYGDCKSLGNGISELRIHYGPGIRIYHSSALSHKLFYFKRRQTLGIELS